MMLNPQYRIFEGRDLMTWRDNGACLDEDPELFFANLDPRDVWLR